MQFSLRLHPHPRHSVNEQRTNYGGIMTQTKRIKDGIPRVQTENSQIPSGVVGPDSTGAEMGAGLVGRPDSAGAATGIGVTNIHASSCNRSTTTTDLERWRGVGRDLSRGSIEGGGARAYERDQYHFQARFESFLQST